MKYVCKMLDGTVLFKIVAEYMSDALKIAEKELYRKCHPWDISYPTGIEVDYMDSVNILMIFDDNTTMYLQMVKEELQ